MLSHREECFHELIISVNEITESSLGIYYLLSFYAVNKQSFKDNTGTFLYTAFILAEIP